MPGPVPKRSEQRRRVNKVEGLQKAPGAATVPIPDASPFWHPLAIDWFNSLKASGQSAFYEPSDWALARLVGQQVSDLAANKKPSAVMFSAIMSVMSDLLVTEGSRRRLRLELQRGSAGPDLAAEAGSDVDAILRAVPGA